MGATTELLPCPFCGGKAKIRTTEYFDGANTFFGCCTVCSVAAPTRIRTDEAIAAWNRRADHLPDATKMVSNADRIRSMSDEDLAEVSVYSTTRPDFDEGFDGEWYECGNIETWHSVFTADLYDSPDDAISYVLEWLQRKEEV